MEKLELGINCCKLCFGDCKINDYICKICNETDKEYYKNCLRYSKIKDNHADDK